MSRFQANCLCLFALICLMAFGTQVNAGCYSGRPTLGQRIAERQLERAEARLERAEARADARAGTSCIDSASFVTGQLYTPATAAVVTSEQSCSASGSCSIQSAPASVTLKIQPAPVYAAVPMVPLIPMQSVRTTTTQTYSSGFSGFQLFGSGGACSSGSCR